MHVLTIGKMDKETTTIKMLNLWDDHYYCDYNHSYQGKLPLILYIGNIEGVLLIGTIAEVVAVV